MRASEILVWVLVTGSVFCGCQQDKVATRQRIKGKGVSMAVTIQWLGHASFRLCSDDVVVYIDPWKLGKSVHDATVVLVSHSHYDHYSAQDIVKVSSEDTKIVGPADVIAKQGGGEVIKPGQTITVEGVKVTGVASYNPGKRFHPQANNWLGFVVEIKGMRIYYAGDTDLTSEMSSLKDIDVALLPVGGTYTMNAEEAAAAVEHIKPKQAIPYHWGDIVGSNSDARRFAESAKCRVTVLRAGESLTLGE